MSPRVNLLALALESSLMLRRASMLLVPFMIATILSFVVYFFMFAGLDPALFEDMDAFFESARVQQIIIIGAACYAILNIMAMGASGAMTLELVKRGRASLRTAGAFMQLNGPRMFLLSLLMGLAVVVGMGLAILPGLLAAFFMMFAPASFVLRSADPLDAIQQSFSIVTANARQCAWLFLSFSLAYMVMNMALMALIFVPVIGVLVGFLMTCGFMAALTVVTLRVYMELTRPVEPEQA